MLKTISIELVRKYLADQCTPEEIEQVNAWFRSYQHYSDNLAELPSEAREVVERRLFEKIQLDIQNKTVRSRIEDPTSPYLPKKNAKRSIGIFAIKSIGIAASLFALLWFSLYLFRQQPSDIPKSASRVKKVNDLPPGGHRALLTLSNGTTIILDSAPRRVIATQGNSSIRKTANGQLVYIVNDARQSTVESAKFNTITTPAGGQYQVMLPDGTQAWLNSRSSLSFPAQFSGSERRVEMTGEVYFEVAKNAGMPFKVKSKGTEIEVLGTHFNMMAYDDESEQKTTLLEGSIKISTTKGLHILKPGQQALVADNGALTLRSGVDVENVVAWKNGFFDFKNVDLATIMRQVSRWYDIHAIFQGQTADMCFTGKIPRDVHLFELLHMLQYMGLKYEIDGKNITFLPEL